MPYEAKYINSFCQIGSEQLRLVLTDSDGIMPIRTIEKKFRFAAQVTEEGLRAEAQKEIARAVQDYELSLYPPDVEVLE